MFSQDYRILSIGSTRELWAKPTAVQDDTNERLHYYARSVKSYQVIVHSLKKHSLHSFEFMPGAWAYPSNGWTPVDSWLKMLLIGLRLGRLQRFDLVQAQDPLYTGTVGAWLSRRWGVPLNVCVYGANPFDPYWVHTSAINTLGAAFARRVLRQADGVQVDGTFTAQILTQAGINAARIFQKPMIPATIKDFFQAQVDPLVRAELDEHGRYTCVALYVGRLALQKDLRLLLEVAQQLTQANVRIACIGDGPLRAQLEHETRQRGLSDRVLWLGARPHMDIPRYMASSDIFVLSSRYEGFARVLMEAAAAGKPIVTTAVSGATDAVVEGETGFIVPVGDARTFTAHVSMLLRQPDLAIRFGRAARRHIRSVVAQYANPALQVDIWRQIIEWRRASAAGECFTG